MVSTKRKDAARVRDRLRDPASSNVWNAEAADMLDALLAERDAARAEAEMLREALTFYANPQVYAPHPHGPAFDRRDLSWHARAALAGEAGHG